jgi:translation initiation factor IF-2
LSASCATNPQPSTHQQCDRLYGWKSAPDTPIRDAFKRQKDFVMKEFDTRSEQVFLQLNEQVGGADAVYAIQAGG